MFDVQEDEINEDLLELGISIRESGDEGGEYLPDEVQLDGGLELPEMGELEGFVAAEGVGDSVCHGQLYYNVIMSGGYIEG